MSKIKVKCLAKTTSTLGEQSEPLEVRRPELVSGSHQIKVKCPAKINLTLEILNKREDGFHNIQSIMQTIDLFDFLTIEISESENFEIKLSGTSDEIPYDERNLVHKAVLLFFNSLPPHFSRGTKNLISVHIEKNIPISAGLAGGSTDAAGVLWGLNELFDKILSKEELHDLCAKLGSDLNFCLEGGCQLTTGRGEILEKLPFCEFNLSLVKPKHLGISAKEAYTKFSELESKPNLNMTQKLVEALNLSGKYARPTAKNCDTKTIEKLIHNDLEVAVFDDYKELQEIKKTYPKSIMSGSGSTYFVLDSEIKPIGEDFWTKTGLYSINYGVSKAH